MVPVVMALARVRPALVAVACGAVYLGQWRFQLDLPAEWWSDRPWFFNPFGWQLIFFTGFAFGSGWLPEPPRRRALLWPAVGFVVLMVPLNWAPIWSSRQWLDEFSLLFVPWKDKTDFGILRYLHFLALAYLALWPVNPRPEFLRGRLTAPVILVGQQALPVFLWSMALAFALGMVLDEVGRDRLTVPLANLGGFASLVTVAALADLVKAQPWRRREARVRHGHPREAAHESAAGAPALAPHPSPSA